MFGLKERARHRLFRKLSHLVQPQPLRLSLPPVLAASWQLTQDNRFLNNTLSYNNLRGLFPQVKSYLAFSTRYLAQVVMRGRLFEALSAQAGKAGSVRLSMAGEFYRAANTASCWFMNEEQNAKKFQNQPFPFVALPEINMAKVSPGTIEADRLLDVAACLVVEVPVRYIPALTVCLKDLKAHPVHPGRPLVPVNLPSHKTLATK